MLLILPKSHLGSSSTAWSRRSQSGVSLDSPKMFTASRSDSVLFPRNLALPCALKEGMVKIMAQDIDTGVLTSNRHHMNGSQSMI